MEKFFVLIKPYRSIQKFWIAEAHYHTTGPEIYEQMQENCIIFWSKWSSINGFDSVSQSLLLLLLPLPNYKKFTHKNESVTSQ